MMSNLKFENEDNEKAVKMYQRNSHYSRWSTKFGIIWIDEEKIRIDISRE